jgi:SAM-dependent methyltransferase
MAATDTPTTSRDAETAQAFAQSWNNLPAGSVYTEAQFVDWMAPLGPEDVRGREVLELGCGNGSLMVHMARWQPRRLTGVDLGDSVATARSNTAGMAGVEVLQGDLTSFASEGYDLVYCIGVLHHLKEPAAGFAAVVRNTRPGGRFHCWVYGREGNAIVVYLVDPIRRLASKLPWWLNKYGVALPLVVPYYLYAKSVRALSALAALHPLLRRLPLHDYSQWIAQRGFRFFWHVAFDQLVTPQTVYLSRANVQALLDGEADVDPASTYVIARNGHSWKFGGRRRGGDTR